MSNWQLAVGSARIYNPTSAPYTTTEATHGSNVLETGGGTTIKQLTNIDLLPNRQYTLNVDVGNRADVADANMFFIIELYAGSQFIGAIHQNNLATVNGGFATGTATYISPANIAAQQKLEIRISAAATLVNFDNVRLSSTVVDEQYAYDSNGNRLSTTGARQSALGSHNRLQTDGTYNYVYDNEGNIIRRTQISDGSVLEYQWDHRNRLTKISTKAAGATVSSRDIFYYYDAFDRRVGKTIDYEGNGVIDRSWVYVFDGQNTVMVLQDADGAGSMQGYRISGRILQGPAVDMVMSEETYLGGAGPLVGSTIASSNSGTTLWTIGDDQGSIQDAVDNNGVVRRRVSYNAFGQRTSQIDTDANGQILPSGSPSALDTLFGYTGRDWDSDAQLQNNRARWYDPTTARWLSQDPIGFAGGDANLYRYVGNKATMATDPNGLEIKSVAPIDSFIQRYVKNGEITIDPSEERSYLAASIILHMMKSKSVFELEGATAKENIANLVLHVKARMRILDNAGAKEANFGAGATQIIHHTKKNMRYKVSDPQEYYMSINNPLTQVNCATLTNCVFKGALGSWYDVVQYRNFESEKDLVPGDWIYVPNRGFVDGKSAGGTAGENLIFAGEKGYWGHFGPGNTYKTWQEWMGEISGWNGGTGNPGHPKFITGPSVGLKATK